MWSTGRPTPAIVPVEVLDAVEAIEHHIDLEAAEDSYAEAGEDVTRCGKSCACPGPKALK
jgi:hypothetical protein